MESTPPKSIGFEIKHISILIGRAFDKHVFTKKDFNNENLTIMQSHIIGFIYGHDNHTIPQHELEKEFNRRRSTITGILKLMEKNGFITREYSKKDARMKMVTLTDKAIQLHQCITKKIDDFNRNLEKGLTEDEVQTFYSIMDKIKKNLE
ncbi:MAG: MarR family winged helix-turn-helix transcriptional regulator [Oscillospiraceae bacterium]